MRLQNWFIRNLDDIQREVIIESIDKSIIVQGVAGSGKTNLAIHRALQAKGKGTYAIVIMTIALRRMISYGMKELGLDNERIAYDWAWKERGFDLIGDVYCKGHYDLDKPVIDDSSIIYLVNGQSIRKFKLVFKEKDSPKDKVKEHFGIDFADWVHENFYKTWERRTSWFKEIDLDNDFSVTNPSYCLVSGGTLYKPCESTIDYLIIDEVQDFKDLYIKNAYMPQVGKSLSLFGDSNQKMYPFGSPISEIQKLFSDFKFYNLRYNYRLPKAIAKVAQKIAQPEIDLLTNNMKNEGNSDYPTFPKPIIKKCQTRFDEIKWIANRIKNETLDDVAILVPNNSDVQEVVKLMADNGISEVQTHYRTGKEVPYYTINTLDFSNNDLPCILDYYAAKGSEFEHVFVPFANEGHVGKRYDFFVACTRASHSLYITYSGVRTSYLGNINNQDIVEFK
ncbi:MAG: DEAD/DEAH box helicase [Bacteroidaceae bacterium]|nr:DEAD/DEAH box helicase [Bacteroidaceae bacterium]